MQLNFDLNLFANNINQIGKDLFERGSSYYFPIPYPEFGGPLSWIAIIGVIGVFLVQRNLFTKDQKLLFIISTVLLPLSLIIPSLASAEPGLRRCTGTLVAFYIFYLLASILVWKISKTTYRNIFVFILLLLPIDHMVAFKRNLKQLHIEAKHNTYPFLNIGETPTLSLHMWLANSRKGKILDCKILSRDPNHCRLSEIFSAIDGYRIWNNQQSIPLYAKPFSSREKIHLHLDLWRNYTLPH